MAIRYATVRFLSCLLFSILLVGGWGFSAHAQTVAFDEASNYNDWDGDPSFNEGNGFNAWTFDQDEAGGDAGRYLGGTAGGAIDPGFGLFSGNDPDAFSSAFRGFEESLEPGDTFSVDIGHSERNFGEIGLNLFNDGDVVFTLKLVDEVSEWQLNDGGNDFDIGGQGFEADTRLTFTFTYEGGSEYSFTFGNASGDNFTASSDISAIDEVGFFNEDQGGGENFGIDNLQITADPPVVNVTQGTDYNTIQEAINDANAGDVIEVAEGTYAEEIAVTVPLTIEGANAGTPGNDTRSAESRIVPASDGQDALVTVQASDVTLDGLAFDSDNPNLTGDRNGSGGVLIPSNVTGAGNLTITNSVFENFPNESSSPGLAFGAGIAGLASDGNPSTGNEISRNLFRNFEGYEFPSGSDPEKASVGIGLADNFYADVSDNVMNNVAFGILMFGIAPASPSQTISGGSISDVHRGIVFYPGDRDAEYVVEDVSINQADEFGIVSFRFDGSAEGLGNGNSDIETTIRNVEIRGTGNIEGDASGIATNAFDGDGLLTTTIEESTISDNQKRGINARGGDDDAVSVTVLRSVIEGNGYDPNANENANGIIAQRGAEITVENSIVNNESANRSAPEADAVSVKAEGQGGAGADGGVMRVFDSQILAPVGNAAASESGDGAALDASGNWWGDTDAATFAIDDEAGVIDYSPFLASDANAATTGFEGDFSTLILDSNSPDQQANTKLEEAVALGGTEEIILQSTAGEYNVPAGGVEVPGRLRVADDLDFDGASGPVSVVNNELVVEDGVSADHDFDIQNRFVGADGPEGENAGWRILGAPRAGVTGDDFSNNLTQASDGSILYTWDGEGQTFVEEELETGSALPSGEGFFLYLFDLDNRDRIGQDPSTSCEIEDACINVVGPVEAGSPTNGFGVQDVSVDVAGEDNPTSTEAGYVLGNPFAQSFDPGEIIVESTGDPLGGGGKFVANVQAWNPLTGEFEVINTNPSDGEFAPWQGFWVLRQENPVDLQAETLTFQSGGLSTGAPFIPSKSMVAPQNGRLFVTLELQDASGEVQSTSRTSLYAHEDATLGSDAYNASRIMPPTSSYALASFVREDGARQAQHSVPYDLNDYVEIPLHVEAVNMEGTAVLSTDDWRDIPATWTLAVTDTHTGEITQLEPGLEYAFDLSGSTASGDGLGGLASDEVEDPRFIVTAGPGGALPVELTDFSGQTDGTDAVLAWTTASETDNAGFRIQQQTDEGTYETLQFVDGAGTTDDETSYQFRVEDLSYGAHTFRLEQVDLDGTATPSEPVTVEVQLEEAFAMTRMAPNPVSQQGQLEVAVRETQDVTIELYDAIGRRVQTLHDGTLEGGQSHQVQVDAQRLSSGMYFVRMRSSAGTQTERFVVVR